MARTDSLSTRRKRALTALLSTPTIEGAAVKCGLSRRTLFRYLADPVFKAALRRQQDATVAAAVAALSGLAGSAIETLRDTLTDPEATPSVKVRAALGILEARRRIAELADLADRVTALEESWQKQ